MMRTWNDVPAALRLSERSLKASAVCGGRCVPAGGGTRRISAHVLSLSQIRRWPPLRPNPRPGAAESPARWVHIPRVCVTKVSCGQWRLNCQEGRSGSSSLGKLLIKFRTLWADLQTFRRSRGSWTRWWLPGVSWAQWGWSKFLFEGVCGGNLGHDYIMDDGHWWSRSPQGLCGTPEGFDFLQSVQEIQSRSSWRSSGDVWTVKMFL